MIAQWLWPAPLAGDLGMLTVALALDLVLPQLPSRFHPVAWMGTLIGGLEKLAPRSGKLGQSAAGAAIAFAIPALLGLGAALTGWGLHKTAVPLYVGLGGLLLMCTFTVRGLTRAGTATAAALTNADLVGARENLRSLVSRERSELSPSQAAGAAVESVAENSTDSFIAPWLYFALFGLAGAFAYRAINTLDSMIGYHGHYEFLGKASARLDDVMNYVPARLSAPLMLLAGALLGLPARRGWRVMRRDSGLTASPNAGWTMSAMAGLLGVRLEKTDQYTLGAEFPEPSAAHIRRAIAVVHVLALLGLIVTIAVLAARHALIGVSG